MQYASCRLFKGHGNEPVFPMFLHKSVWHGSLTVPFDPFRFRLHIRGDIRIWKTTPCYQLDGESPTPRISDTESRPLPVSMIHRVAEFFFKKTPYQWYWESTIVDENLRITDSPHHWYVESTTPRITDMESHQLPVSLMRRVSDSPYPWYAEFSTPLIVDTGSWYLKKKN